MTHSGIRFPYYRDWYLNVLIPLLLDDPLWVIITHYPRISGVSVLIPLLLDDPLWDESEANTYILYWVLIPLLLDDPLWGNY